MNDLHSAPAVRVNARTARRTAGVVAALAAAATLAGPSPATAAVACSASALQASVSNLDSSTEPTASGYVFAGARVQIGTRCKTGRAGRTYSARVCVRHPGNVVRCRNVVLRGDRWSNFVVKTGGAAKTYRVSWSQRSGSRVVLRSTFRTYTGFEPPDSGN